MSTTGIMGGIDACETSGVGRWVGPEGTRGAGFWKEGPGGVEGARGAGWGNTNSSYLLLHEHKRYSGYL